MCLCVCVCVCVCARVFVCVYTQDVVSVCSEENVSGTGPGLVGSGLCCGGVNGRQTATQLMLRHGGSVSMGL